MHQMTTRAATEKLKSDGWKIVETTGFLQLIGPLWQRMVEGEPEYALITEDKHHNRRGLVQGGVLMTFADRTCGMTARHVSGKPTMALTGGALERLRQITPEGHRAVIHLSLTDDHPYAQAFVIIEALPE